LRRLLTTDEHQLWIAPKDRWGFAADLQAGDRLLLAGGHVAEVVESTRYPADTEVYNLDVEGYESYFANGVLAYQDCGGKTTAAVDDHLRAYLRARGSGSWPGETYPASSGVFGMGADKGSFREGEREGVRPQ
jgi:hypothetical protein